MNTAVMHLGLAAVVFAPAPDDVPLSVITSDHAIDAQVALHALPDEDRIAAWRRVFTAVGEQHGDTPWTFYLTPYGDGRGNVRALHRFDGVITSVWTALEDTEAAAGLLPEVEQ